MSGPATPQHQVDAIRAALLRQRENDLKALAEGRYRDSFVFLYPSENKRCAAAVADYAETLTDRNTFCTWTLESVVAALRGVTAEPWVHHFGERYLGVS